MRERISPVASPMAFRKVCRAVELLQQHGVPEEVIDALLEEKILTDLAKEKAKRRNPSLN